MWYGTMHDLMFLCVFKLFDYLKRILIHKKSFFQIHLSHNFFVLNDPSPLQSPVKVRFRFTRSCVSYYPLKLASS